MKKLLVVASWFLVGLPSMLQADSVLLFNEIMYHPSVNESNMEWVEFYNPMSVDIDVSGWSLDGGIGYTFPSNSIIRGGGFVVVSVAPAALRAATGATNVVGPYTNRLGNNGNHLILRNNSGRVLDEVEYDVEGD